LFQFIHTLCPWKQSRNQRQPAEIYLWQSKPVDLLRSQLGLCWKFWIISMVCSNCVFGYHHTGSSIRLSYWSEGLSSLDLLFDIIGRHHITISCWHWFVIQHAICNCCHIIFNFILYLVIYLLPNLVWCNTFYTVLEFLQYFSYFNLCSLLYGMSWFCAFESTHPLETFG
jgi:hypothetical protein